MVAVSSEDEIMVGMLWARAEGMMNGLEIGARLRQYLSMRIVCDCVHVHGMNESMNVR